MNICFILSSFTRGGIGRVTALLANRLNMMDNINCYGLGHTNNNIDDIYETEFPVQYLFHDKVTMKTALLNKHYIKRVKKYVLENNIQILIACDELFYPAAVIVARLCHIKVICWEHTNPYVTSDYQFEKESRWFGANFSDCNVLLTKQAQEIFNRKYPHKRNMQIYNPVDPKLYENDSLYNESSKRIITVGRITYQKNFERLIRIASHFILQYQEWEWDIYGNGPDEEKIKLLIKKNSLESQIHLCGQVNDLYHRYKEYAFIIMTSRYEGFPMTLLEAAANGLPMISFDVLTGPREIIANGENGFLCNSNSDEEMIEKIQVLMKDVQLRKKMSMESKKIVEKFRNDKICGQWVKLFNELIS